MQQHTLHSKDHLEHLAHLVCLELSQVVHVKVYIWQCWLTGLRQHFTEAAIAYSRAWGNCYAMRSIDQQTVAVVVQFSWFDFILPGNENRPFI